MKFQFIVVCLLVASATAVPQGYGNSYGGSSYSAPSAQTYSGPNQNYNSQPVSYVTPQVTFTPPQIIYTHPKVTYSQAHTVSVPQPNYPAASTYSSGSSSYSAPAMVMGYHASSYGGNHGGSYGSTSNSY